MKEHPILFNPEMVKAVLDGRKTQTRRIVKPQPEYRENESVPWHFGTFFHGWNLDHEAVSVKDVVEYCPYGQVGDLLYVRERFCVGAVVAGDSLPEEIDPEYIEQCKGQENIIPYEWAIREDIGMEDVKWKPSIHMPKAASRISLKITNIRIERVQDISTEDILSEGIIQRFPKVNDQFTPTILRGAFIELWNSTTDKKEFQFRANPWVWVVEFKLAEI